MTPPTVPQPSELRDKMNWFRALFCIAIASISHGAFAKQKMTDPLKIARECKSDLALLCKAARPGRQRVIKCLKEKATELSPGCAAALKSME
jgi:hypothetical protein